MSCGRNINVKNAKAMGKDVSVLLIQLNNNKSPWNIPKITCSTSGHLHQALAGLGQPMSCQSI